MPTEREQAIALLLAKGVPPAVAEPVVEMLEMAINAENEACAAIAAGFGEGNPAPGGSRDVKDVTAAIARAIRARRQPRTGPHA